VRTEAHQDRSVTSAAASPDESKDDDVRRNNGSVLGLASATGVGAWSRLTIPPASVGGRVSDGPLCQ